MSQLASFVNKFVYKVNIFKSQMSRSGQNMSFKKTYVPEIGNNLQYIHHYQTQNGSQNDSLSLMYMPRDYTDEY